MVAATNALRSIATKADPTLRVSDVQPLDRVNAPMVRTFEYIARGFGALTLSMLMLALSGIYAVMSFAVSRRTREIGIRVALGSPSWHVVLTILRRPLLRLAAGIVFGGMLAFWISSADGVTLGLSATTIETAGVDPRPCMQSTVDPGRLRR
jgi:putative ABC transport system permease protein